jgi:adenosine kinase
MGLLGGKPMVLAAAGEDFGSYRTWLEGHGVDTSGIVEIEDEFCASFFCTTDSDQNQIATFYPGAMAHSHRLTFRQYAPDADLAIISPSDPGAMQQHAAECRELGIPFIFDPSQQTIRFTGEQLLQGLAGSRLLTTNEYEFSLIMDKTGLSESDILARTGGILVTQGKKGSWLKIDGEEHFIPTVTPHEIVEPTGAGDAFRAGFMRGMQLGVPWSVCGRMGALAATYVLENFGTQNHRYPISDFVARYRAHFDDEGALDGLVSAESPSP